MKNILMLKKQLILKIQKRKNFLTRVTKRYFFDLPLKIIKEKIKLKRILPSSGDLVVIKFYDKITGLKISFFRLYVCFGICISSKKKSILSSFLIRNGFLHNSIEFNFFLYSPLLFKLNIYSNRCKNYKKSKLFHLRSKKLSYSRIRL